MGEHISYIYTNTFRVSDRSAFETFCQSYHLTAFTDPGGSTPDLVGFWGESDSSALLTEENALLEMLAKQLADGQVAIAIDIAYYSEEDLEGNLPPRGVWAIAYAVSSSGELLQINTGDIIKRAEAIGVVSTPPQWM